MKKIAFTFLIMICSLNYTFSDEIIPMNINNILSSKWAGEYDCDWTYNVTFNEDNTFKARLSSEGGDTCVSGKYIIKGSSIIFSIKTVGLDKGNTDCEVCSSCTYDSKDIFNPNKYFDKKEYVLMKSSSLHYTEYLYCKESNTKLWNNSKPLKSGSEIKYENYNHVSISFITCITSSNVKLRKKPTITADVIKYLDTQQEKMIDYIPKGIDVIIIARTSTKDNVNNINNYWYYVEVKNSHYCERGWMFGEFVRIN
jgi:hypothetical protein